MALAGQRTSTRRATATPLAHDGQLPRNHLGLERRCELLRFVEPQPEVGQARLLATLNARPLSRSSRRLEAPPPASHATPASAPAHPLSVSPKPNSTGSQPPWICMLPRMIWAAGRLQEGRPDLAAPYLTFPEDAVAPEMGSRFRIYDWLMETL